MDFFDVINQRQSIRRFTSQPVEPAKISRLLETANQAPSAGNLQAYSIVVISDSKIKHALVDITAGQKFVAQAPIILVFCAEPERSAYYGERGRSLYAIQDATIAAVHVQLAATALGLGSTWMGKFEDAPLQKLLGLNQNQRPVAILPIGYPDEQPPRKPRRQLTEFVSRR